MKPINEFSVHNVDLELIEDPAPHQFSEPGDYIMIYKLVAGDELLCSTDEGWTVEQMTEICLKASIWFKDVAKVLKKKKQLGDRCS
jgi:hypothetical protein